MTPNPLVNALCALGYIACVALFVIVAPTYLPQETIAALPHVVFPIGFLSLFVFSAALMGFIVLYYPLRYLMAGEAQKAARLFFLTLLSFGVATVILLGAAVVGSLYI